MASVFELSKTRTGHKRDIVEEELRKQIDEFEDKLKVTNRELELFMKKDPPVLTMDEMRGCVQTIDKLDSRARECVETLKEINQEEVYLGEKYNLVGLFWFYIICRGLYRPVLVGLVLTGPVWSGLIWFCSIDSYVIWSCLI